jgi:hypothetical protein
MTCSLAMPVPPIPSPPRKFRGARQALQRVLQGAGLRYVLGRSVTVSRTMDVSTSSQP